MERPQKVWIVIQRDLAGRATRICCVRRFAQLLIASSIAGFVSTLLGGAASADGSRAVKASGHMIQTNRVFQLGPGRAQETFTLRERSGVILINRLTVPHGVRAYADATIPQLAGALVSTITSASDPSLTCRRGNSFDVCTQEEEWCPMPKATWHVHLVKLDGPAGVVRFDFVVREPPHEP